MIMSLFNHDKHDTYMGNQARADALIMLSGTERGDNSRSLRLADLHLREYKNIGAESSSVDAPGARALCWVQDEAKGNKARKMPPRNNAPLLSAEIMPSPTPEGKAGHCTFDTTPSLPRTSCRRVSKSSTAVLRTKIRSCACNSASAWRCFSSSTCATTRRQTSPPRTGTAARSRARSRTTRPSRGRCASEYSLSSCLCCGRLRRAMSDSCVSPAVCTVSATRQDLSQPDRLTFADPEERRG